MNGRLPRLPSLRLRNRGKLAVGHTGDPIPPGTERYRADPPVRGLRTEGTGAVVSVLAKGGRRFLVIVNRDHLKEMPLAIDLESGKAVERIGKDGKPARIEGASFRAVLAPGDAAILAWDKDVSR